MTTPSQEPGKERLGSGKELQAEIDRLTQFRADSRNPRLYQGEQVNGWNHFANGVSEAWPQIVAALTAAREELEQVKRERDEARLRLLSAAGDDLCRLTQDEIKAMSAGAVKIPPKDEFLASCERFHSQVAKESGVLTGCMTLAQMIAENEKLRQRATAAEAANVKLMELIRETIALDEAGGKELSRLGIEYDHAHTDKLRAALAAKEKQA